MDLNKYLNNKDRRLLTILEFLTFTNNKISVYEIQKITKCSNRTVYNDIEELKDRFSEEFKFEFKNNVLSTYDVNYSSYEYVRKKIFNDSKSILLIQKIFMYPKRTIKDYSKMNCVSSSHTYNLLYEFKEKLIEDNIILNQKPIYFSPNNEKNVRIFLTNTYYINKRYLNCDFYKKIEQDLQYTIAITPELQAITPNKLFKEFLLVFLFVSYVRDRQSYYFCSGNDINKSFNVDFEVHESPTVKKITQIIRKEVLFALERSKSKKNRIEKSLLNSKFISPKINGEQLLLKLYMFIGITQHFDIAELVIYQRFLLTYESIEKTNQSLINELNDMIINLVKEEYNVKTDEERFKILIALLVMWSPDIRLTCPKNIFIVSDLSKLHAEKICNKIKMKFNENKYSYYYVNELQEQLDRVNDADFIISTVSIDKVSKDKQILINDLVLAKDLLKIHSVISSDLRKNREKLHTKISN